MPALPPRPTVVTALLRGAVGAALLAAGAAAVDLALYGRAFRGDLVVGACAGLAAAPLAWFEHVLRPVRGAWARARLLLWTLAGAVLAGAATAFQAAYTEGLLTHGSWEDALDAAAQGAWLAAFDPLTGPVLVAFALPFAAAAAGRRVPLPDRPWAPWARAGLGVAWGGLGGLAVLRAAGAWGYLREVMRGHPLSEPTPMWGLPTGPQAALATIDAPDWTVGRYALAVVWVSALLLPLAYALADRLVAAWRRRAGADPAAEPVAAELPGPVARAVPWLVVAAALALAPVLAHLARAHPPRGQLARWVDYAGRSGRAAFVGRVLERTDASDHPRLTPALLEELGAKEGPRRRWALILLGRMGPACREDAAEALIAAAEDPDPSIATLAVRTLGRVEVERARPLLIELVFTEGWDRKGQAAERSLAELGFRWDATATDAVVAYLEHDSWDARRRALRRVRSMGPAAAAAAPTVVRSLDDGPWSDVVETLAAVGPAALPAIRAEVLGRAEPGARVQALEAVGELEPGEAVWDLLDEAARHRAVEVRRAAAAAVADGLADRFLGRLVGPDRERAVGLLLALSADPDPHVRNTAQRGFWRLGTGDLVPLLLAHLGDPDSPHRAAAARALPQLRVGADDEEALGLLLEAARDRDPEVRAAVAQALTDWAWKEEVGEVLARLRVDRAPAVRAAAIGALASRRPLGRDRAEDLVRALSDPAAEVRRAAVGALASRRPLGRERVADLGRALSDPAAEVRRTAALALCGRTYRSGYWSHASPSRVERGWIEPHAERIAAVLVEDLRAGGTEDEAAVVLAALEEVAGAVPEDAIPVLAERVATGARDARRSAVDLLARIGGPEAMWALRPALADLDRGVGRAARHALRGAGADAVPVLLDALEDPDSSVRLEAIRALTGRRTRVDLDAEARARVRSALADRLEREEDGEVARRLEAAVERYRPRDEEPRDRRRRRR